jgi:hypothetical protein
MYADGCHTQHPQIPRHPCVYDFNIQTEMFHTKCADMMIPDPRTNYLIISCDVATKLEGKCLFREAHKMELHVL